MWQTPVKLAKRLVITSPLSAHLIQYPVESHLDTIARSRVVILIAYCLHAVNQNFIIILSN
jgi:hypothetical protein